MKATDDGQRSTVDADIAAMDGEDMVDEIMRLRAELEYCKRLALEADECDAARRRFRKIIIDRRLAAAKIEGLRIVKRQSEILDWEEFANWLDAEIAALERGKERP